MKPGHLPYTAILGRRARPWARRLRWVSKAHSLTKSRRQEFKKTDVTLIRKKTYGSTIYEGSPREKTDELCSKETSARYGGRICRCWRETLFGQVRICPVLGPGLKEHCLKLDRGDFPGLSIDRGIGDARENN